MKKLEVAQRMHISAKMSLGWRWVGMKEMAHALWEGHTLLKTGLSAHRQTDRQTKVKTVYPPVSLRSLGGHKNSSPPFKGFLYPPSERSELARYHVMLFSVRPSFRPSVRTQYLDANMSKTV